MRKIVAVSLFLIAFIPCFAQQDAQYSQYMFNQAVLNPAYVGSKDALNTSLLLRNQWVGIEGAPKTETFSIHGPLKNKKIGLGLNVIADEIGPAKSTGIFGSYSYRIRIRNAKLAMGIRYGLYNFSYNRNIIEYKDKADIYNTNNTAKRNTQSADAGIYYYTNTLYFGLSMTHIFREPSMSLDGNDILLSPHIFATFGKAFQKSENLIFNPSFVIKTAENVSPGMDLNLNVLIDQKIWLGVSGRLNYGFVFLTQYSITDQLKFGYAYDLGLNGIGKKSKGTHEIMIGYDFNILKAKMVSPRYL